MAQPRGVGRWLLGAAGLALVVSGCSGGEEDSKNSSTSTSATTVPVSGASSTVAPGVVSGPTGSATTNFTAAGGASGTGAPTASETTVAVPTTQPPVTEPPSTEPPSGEPGTTLVVFEAVSEFCNKVTAGQAIADTDYEGQAVYYEDLGDLLPEPYASDARVIGSTYRTASAEGITFEEAATASEEFAPANTEYTAFESTSC